MGFQFNPTWSTQCLSVPGCVATCERAQLPACAVCWLKCAYLCSTPGASRWLLCPMGTPHSAVAPCPVIPCPRVTQCCPRSRNTPTGLDPALARVHRSALHGSRHSTACFDECTHALLVLLGRVEIAAPCDSSPLQSAKVLLPVAAVVRPFGHG